jgi:biotin carboxyl carrier protein
MKKKLRITVEGKTYEVEVEEITVGGTPVQRPAAVEQKPAAQAVQPAPQQAEQTQKPAKPSAVGGETLPAPIPGKILSIKVQEGQEVKAGQVVLILEAMKMENEITAPIDGEIKEILVKEGQSVNTGEGLITIG